MKNLCTFILFFFTFSSFSQNKKDDKIYLKIQKLERQINKLQTQLEQEKQKSKLVYFMIRSNSAFASPWEQFLSGPDQLFDYDPFGLSAYSECCKSCSKNYSKEKENCYKMPDGQGKIDCINKVSKKIKKCREQSCNPLINLN